jgi:hypothetical protein
MGNIINCANNSTDNYKRRNRGLGLDFINHTDDDNRIKFANEKWIGLTKEKIKWMTNLIIVYTILL